MNSINEDDLINLSILLSKIYKVDIAIRKNPYNDFYHLTFHQQNRETFLGERICGCLQAALNYIYCNYCEYDDIPF